MEKAVLFFFSLFDRVKRSPWPQLTNRMEMKISFGSISNNQCPEPPACKLESAAFSASYHLPFVPCLPLQDFKKSLKGVSLKPVRWIFSHSKSIFKIYATMMMMMMIMIMMMMMMMMMMIEEEKILFLDLNFVLLIFFSEAFSSNKLESNSLKWILSTIYRN
ncbi:hypothetical protein LOAG_10370 [Loa loa]|uniref:Uncharacterized protein n=1 Tax=Loa loa TaxID=7209 RepID=A0A1S0TRJ8_LOALO|nr:hypothetical protein LOAG_10370 [Loa loa]EFO18128.1 hypothetical protein LOAG_10370 [Loa loa]